jgi:hypothetical protein
MKDSSHSRVAYKYYKSWGNSTTIVTGLLSSPENRGSISDTEKFFLYSKTPKLNVELRSNTLPNSKVFIGQCLISESRVTSYNGFMLHSQHL